jgi:hypothetical protein
MCFFVKLPSGRSITLYMMEMHEVLVSKIKEAIEDNEGISPNLYSLTYKGYIL